MKFVELKKIDDVWKVINYNDESLNLLALFLINLKSNFFFDRYLFWLMRNSADREGCGVSAGIYENNLPPLFVGFVSLNNRIFIKSHKGQEGEQISELNTSSKDMQEIITTWKKIYFNRNGKQTHVIIKILNGKINFHDADD